MRLGDLRLSCRLLAPVVAFALALAALGCGGDSTGNGTTNPTASAPEATAPPTDATQPGTGTTTTPPETTTQPAQTQTQPSSGGGERRARRGEQTVRVPARFAVVDGHLQPRTITVPPFLAVELSLSATDRAPHRLSLLAPEGQTLDRYPGQRVVSALIPGMRPGRYQIRLDYLPAGALIVGGEVGP